ncbi:MAG TPA: prepilin peptidase [Vicinamibacteria bacterium]|nr:prepilin peptidase [Vicinamibacteria bacterium]
MPPLLAPAALLEPPLFEWVALAMGLVVGSFANVCIHRLPRHESIVFPASSCPTCSAPIPARDNVPVLGFLLLGGWCRSCRTPISLRYPAVEALNGAVYWFLAATRGATAGTFVAMGLATGLLVLSLVDLDHHLLPDAVTLPGIAVGCLASLVRQPPGPLEAALSAAFGYLGMALVARAAEWHYGEEALGQGDWKMIAMLGAFLGARPMLTALFLATAVGAALGLAMIALGRGSRRMRLPLGTFLGLGGLAVLLAGDALLGFYDRFFLFVVDA